MANLSEHFTLEEMTVTSHTEVDNTPQPEHLENLKKLCSEFLEPLRLRFGPLRINSGYRSPALNAAVPGSAKDSAHRYGCAADIAPPDGTTVRDMVLWLRDESGLDFDQAIDELRSPTGSPWLHLGMLRPDHEPQPRKQCLVMRNGRYTEFK